MSRANERAAALRDAASRHGYDRDEVVGIGRAFQNPRAIHLQPIIGGRDVPRFAALGLRDSGRQVIHVVSTMN